MGTEDNSSGQVRRYAVTLRKTAKRPPDLPMHSAKLRHSRPAEIDPLLSVTTVCYRESNRNAVSDGIRSLNRGRRFPFRCEKPRGRKVTPLRIGPPKGASINRYPSTSSGRTVNINHVLGYNTSGSSTLFFRFGRTHITPG